MHLYFQVIVQVQKFHRHTVTWYSSRIQVRKPPLFVTCYRHQCTVRKAASKGASVKRTSPKPATRKKCWRLLQAPPNRRIKKLITFRLGNLVFDIITLALWNGRISKVRNNSLLAHCSALSRSAYQLCSLELRCWGYGVQLQCKSTVHSTSTAATTVTANLVLSKKTTWIKFIWAPWT